MTQTGYAFDRLVTAQLGCIERYLDPITAERLAPLVRDGDRCWEVGAGGGSVARLLSRTVGPTGLVVATDIDTSHLTRLTRRPGLVVQAQDVRRDPVPAGGPFRLIHARLLLLHLPERRAVLRTLAGALAPGGWLVVEEFACAGAPRVLRAPDGGEKLFTQVMEVLLGLLEQRGADLGWAHEVYDEMADAGLTDIDARVHAESWRGGSAGARLYEVNSAQLEPALRDAGIDAEQLTRFRRLTRDPRFAALSYQFVSTRARRH